MFIVLGRIILSRRNLILFNNKIIEEAKNRNILEYPKFENNFIFKFINDVQNFKK